MSPLFFYQVLLPYVDIKAEPVDVKARKAHGWEVSPGGLLGGAPEKEKPKPEKPTLPGKPTTQDEEVESAESKAPVHQRPKPDHLTEEQWKLMEENRAKAIALNANRNPGIAVMNNSNGGDDDEATAGCE